MNLWPCVCDFWDCEWRTKVDHGVEMGRYCWYRRSTTIVAFAGHVPWFSTIAMLLHEIASQPWKPQYFLLACCWSWCLHYACNARSQTPRQRRRGTRMKATGLTCQTRELSHSGLGHHFVWVLFLLCFYYWLQKLSGEQICAYAYVEMLLAC